MIKTIDKIKSIGCLKDCDWSSNEFGKTTLIYGDNTMGKTTLCDIFDSMSTNNFNKLVERKSIESNNDTQEFTITLFDNPTKLSWSSNSNQSSDLNDLSIKVFGTGFIQKNIFTNSSVSTENEKNFTDFIVGRIGIKLKEQILSKKDKKRLVENEISTKKYNLSQYKGIDYDLYKKKVLCQMLGGG